MKPRFEIWKSEKNKQWYWRLRAGNGRIVCQSEGYKRRKDAVTATNNFIWIVDDAYSI